MLKILIGFGLGNGSQLLCCGIMSVRVRALESTYYRNSRACQMYGSRFLRRSTSSFVQGNPHHHSPQLENGSIYLSCKTKTNLESLIDWKRHFSEAIHTYIHTYMQVHTYIHSCVHIFIHACMHVHTCIHMYTNTSMYTFMHTYL